jgi:hypothetical protein
MRIEGITLLAANDVIGFPSGSSNDFDRSKSDGGSMVGAPHDRWVQLQTG